VVLVSSLYAGVARVGRSNYSMSKAAVEALARGLAIEWANDDVLVNALRPGYVRTDMTMQNNSAQSLDRLIELIPLKRLAEPSEVAEVIRFLMSPQNTYLTGQVISLDGGLSAGAQPWNR
jgi:3-oxoacyl-[acyl-carrier protein] reductase